MLVSVCIPTYNGEKYLQEALDSLERQTYRYLEVVISDDNSTDKTLEIVNKFSDTSNFPVYVYKHSPAGIGANWNNCIKNSNGKYIKFLFQDDILFPSCIEDMMHVMMKDNGIGMVASKREILKPQKTNQFQDEWINSYSDLQKDWDYRREGIVYLDREFLMNSGVLKKRQNQIGEPTTILFKKSVLKKVGFFREDLIQDLDYEFYNRVLKYYKIALLKEKLVGFRLHTGQATFLNRNDPCNDTKILDRIFLKEFFWYLDSSEKRKLLLKYFPRFRRLIKLIW